MAIDLAVPAPLASTPFNRVSLVESPSTRPAQVECSTRHPWDDAAQGWSEHTGLIREWLREATAAMLDDAQIASGQCVLDVAAGAGDQTVDVAHRIGPTGVVMATDVSARILELAQARFQAEGLTRISVWQADAQSLPATMPATSASLSSLSPPLPLPAGRFDAAVCRLGLMFCKDPVAALKGIRSLLALHGRFSAIVFAGPSVNPCITMLMQAACRHAGIPPPDPYAPGTLLSLGRPGHLEQLLHQAGYQDIAVRPIAAPFRTATCDAYIDFLRASASPVIEMLKPLPPQARIDAWNDIARQLACYTTSRGWEGPNQLLLCSGRNP